MASGRRSINVAVVQLFFLYEVLLSENIDWLDPLVSEQAADQPVVLVTAIDRERVTKWQYLSGQLPAADFPPHLGEEIDAILDSTNSLPRLLRSAEEEFFVESMQKRVIDLMLFGAGHVAKEVVNVLQNLPFQITWIDSRSDQFPSMVPDNTRIKISTDPVAEAAACPAGSLYLVMTHSHELDEDICYQVLSTN